MASTRRRPTPTGGTQSSSNSAATGTETATASANKIRAHDSPGKGRPFDGRSRFVAPRGSSRHLHSQTASPQRSSLRRALRNSLVLSDDATLSPCRNARVPPISPISTPLSKPAPILALHPRSQRSSLRRAIYESLQTIHTDYDHSASQANDSASTKKPNTETCDQATGEGATRGRVRKSLADPECKAVLLTTPQRSSLRRAVRESRHAAVESHIHMTPAPRKKKSSQAIVLANTAEVALSEPVSRNEGPLSLSNSEPNLSTKLTPSQPSHYTLEPPSLHPSSPSLCVKPRSPTKAARHQSSNVAGKDRNAPHDGNLQSRPSDTQSTPTAKGWHGVRQIFNEVPGGLYLVEWEGRDPRTGVKWPASWVKAENVSASAIHDWEKRKRVKRYFLADNNGDEHDYNEL
ncbi:hypothetical protein F4802DRAFT_601585 [Xylaria palmicola]|nr:hypothetical protein F4802DRAFT_601585 [Xylaria palmicola]